jgi:glucosamine kinase
MVRTPLLLGIDGGGTGSRARLFDLKGHIRGEGTAGPANIRFGIKESFAAVLRATDEAFAQAGLSLDDADIVACLALAGATEPTHLAQRAPMSSRSAVSCSPPTRTRHASGPMGARMAGS